ncbi:hypothetical protein M5K25_000309 [Dendrobium thyrsiflorum]|uniref:Uncharacterized protein n=1 Tax=Dendrobium thyrsiflorum TaxID=117978 RepID=A0ABD0VV14_DENTH
MAASSTSSLVDVSDPVLSFPAVSIPPQLKFFMANVKTMVNVQLISENHLIWKSQLLKLFTANNFDGYLIGSTEECVAVLCRVKEECVAVLCRVKEECVAVLCRVKEECVAVLCRVKEECVAVLCRRKEDGFSAITV